MRILHTVEFYYPSIGGAQEVVKRVSEELVNRGHSVTVVTAKLSNRTSKIINGVNIVEFDFIRRSSSDLDEELKKYHQFLLNGKFDVMMNYSIQIWTTDSIFPILDQLPYPRALATVGLFSLFDVNHTNYFNNLPEIMKKYNRIILHSATYRESDFCKNNGISHYIIIPNGASLEEFNRNPDHSFRQRYRIKDNVPLLLSVGNHTGLKGHDLAIEAFSRARIKSGTLVIIGKNLFDEYGEDFQGCYSNCKLRSKRLLWKSFGKKRVLLLDLPRQEVISAYHAADMFLFASRVEASPIVLFESMASKTPFITVACGNAAEIVEWSKGGVVVPSVINKQGYVEVEPKILALEIEKLINDRENRLIMAENGYHAFQSKYNWENISLQYEALYNSMQTK